MLATMIAPACGLTAKFVAARARHAEVSQARKTISFVRTLALTVPGAENNFCLRGILYQMARRHQPREQSVVELCVCQRLHLRRPMLASSSQAVERLAQQDDNKRSELSS